MRSTPGATTTQYDNFTRMLLHAGKVPVDADTGSGDYSAHCPAHDDGTPSLHVTRTVGGGVLVHCHAGCSNEVVMQSLTTSWEEVSNDSAPLEGGAVAISPASSPEISPLSGAVQNGAEPGERPASAPVTTGCTVETLGAYLWPSADGAAALRWSGCEDAPWYPTKGAKAGRVAFAYDDATRYRKALTGGDHFSWKKGTKVKGEGRLFTPDDISDATDVVLVGGESDAITVRYFGGYYAAGIPGEAIPLDERHVAKIANAKRIFVIVEPDKGGDQLLAHLTESPLRDRLWIARLPDAKDARELFNRDPANFPTNLAAALTNSKTLAQLDHAERMERAAAALEGAGDLPREANILEAFLADLEYDGLVGEKAIAAGTALSIVSALGKKKTASVLIKGASSGGKSFTEREVQERFPESYFYYLSNASERALIYLPSGTLEHRCLILAEAVGLEKYDGGSSGLADAVRVLQSEGRLDYDTVITSAGSQPQTVHIQQDGPTSLVVTTTAARIHAENETRALSMRIDDSEGQTRGVMDTTAAKYAALIEPVDKDRWHAYFEWLRAMYIGTDVVVPFAPALASLIPPVEVRMRRDISTLLNFVCAHALLHAETREKDEQGRIVATLHDYAIVRHYLGTAFSENVAATVPDSVRETVEAVVAIIERKTGVHHHASYSELGKELGVGRDAATTRALHAIDKGFLIDSEERKKSGLGAKLQLGEPLPDSARVKHLLPTVEDLQARLGHRTEGAQ